MAKFQEFRFSPEELDRIRSTAPYVELHGDKLLRFFSKPVGASSLTEFGYTDTSPWCGRPKAKRAKLDQGGANGNRGDSVTPKKTSVSGLSSPETSPGCSTESSPRCSSESLTQPATDSQVEAAFNFETAAGDFSESERLDSLETTGSVDTTGSLSQHYGPSPGSSGYEGDKDC